MKRLLVALSLVAVSSPAFAFESKSGEPVRIGILRVAGAYHDEWIERAVRETLRNELREERFDAFLTEATFGEVEREADRGADFYVELVSDARTEDYGGIGVGGRHADVTLGMLVSRMAAEVRVYDGRTLELLAEESVHRRKKAMVPTSVGFGGRSLFAVIALPFVERAQVRSIARGVGRDMADIVADVVRGE